MCCIGKLFVLTVFVIGLLEIVRRWSSQFTCHNWYSSNGGLDGSVPDVVRDFCSEIIVCRGPFDWHKRHPVFSTHAGKDIVIPVYVKNSSASFPALYKKASSEETVFNMEIISSVPLDRIVYNHIVANYAHFVPDAFFCDLQNLTDNELQQIFSMIHQDEFFLLKVVPYLNSTMNHFPHLIGICNGGYLVEKIPEIIDETFILDKSWNEMITIIQSFVHLVEAMDALSFEMCDIQLGNFGWDPNSGNVKIIDLDLVFFRELLSQQLIGRKCLSNDDCGIIDCGGKCDTDTETCTGIIANGNLGRVCQDIFQPSFWRKGLFSGAPLSLKPELHQLIRLCDLGINVSGFRTAFSLIGANTEKLF